MTNLHKLSGSRHFPISVYILFAENQTNGKQPYTVCALTAAHGKILIAINLLQNKMKQTR